MKWKDIADDECVLELPQGILHLHELTCIREGTVWYTNKHFFSTKEEAQQFVESALRVQLQRCANDLGGIIEWHPPLEEKNDNKK